MKKKSILLASALAVGMVILPAASATATQWYPASMGFYSSSCGSVRTLTAQAYFTAEINGDGNEINVRQSSGHATQVRGYGSGMKYWPTTWHSGEYRFIAFSTATSRAGVCEV